MTKGFSSPAQSAPARRGVSLGKSGLAFPGGKSAQFTLPNPPLPLSLNDDPLVRAALSGSCRRSKSSREQIADRMTELLGQRVTEKMLWHYSADSMPANKFPLAWVRAFCEASGDSDLLRCCAEAAGLVVIDQSDAELLELGRQYLRQKQAAERVALLERRLQGVDL